MQYNAFISYNKAADMELAPFVRKALEQFAKPVFKRKALRVFLDSSSLAATPDLWSSIQKGLEESEYCVFLASPGSAKSPWCIKELQYWKANKDVNKLFIIWTHGNLDWDDANNDFNWQITDAFPKDLQGVFKNEPLYIDLREQYSRDQFTLNNPAFKNYIGMLAAPMHGKALEDLIDEDIAQHKKTIRLRNAAIGILSALFLVASGLAFYANQQKNIARNNQLEAEKQKQFAILQSHKALAKSYLADSRSNEQYDPTLAFHLAVMGYNFVKNDVEIKREFEEQLIRTFNGNHYFYVAHEDFKLDTKILFPFKKSTQQGNYRLQKTSNGGVQINNIQIDTAPIVLTDYCTHYTFIPGGKYIAVYTDLSKQMDYSMRFNIYDLKGKTIVDMMMHEKIQYPYFSTNTAGNAWAVSDKFEVKVMRMNDNGSLENYVLEVPDKVSAVSISNSGNRVAVGCSNGKIRIYDLDEGSNRYEWTERTMAGHSAEGVDAMRFSADEQYLYSQSKNIKRKWNINKKQCFISCADDEFKTFEGEKKTTTNEGSFFLIASGNKVIEIAYKTEKGEPVTRITNLGLFNENRQSESGIYQSTAHGLYNAKNELLIALKYRNNQNSEAMMRYFESTPFSGFSADGTYFYYTNKLYFLNADAIVKRFADVYGKFEPFSEADKSRYLIVNGD